MTLGDVRTLVRQRADMVNTQFVTDDELNNYINLSYTELYDILISRFEDYYITGPINFSITTGNTYKLPDDFYKLRGVDGQISNGEWFTVRKFNFAERNRRNRQVNRAILLGNISLSYRILGEYLYFLPEDQAISTYRLFYIPKCAELTSDASDLDGINGWEEYVIVDAAIKCLQKEESDTTVLERAKASLIQRINNMADNRDANDPERVSDVTRNYYDWDYLYWR